MTCGICNPKGFREAWQSSHWLQEKGARVWGYAADADATKLATQIRHLYYHGAEHVLADFPEGDVRERPGFKTLSHPIYLRKGDTLLLASEYALSNDPAEVASIEDDLESNGVAVWDVSSTMEESRAG